MTGGYVKYIIAADQSKKSLVDLLIVYVLVSGVQSELLLDADNLAEVHGGLRQNSGEVAGAFAHGGVAEISEANTRALVTHGCIEVFVEQDLYWGMFKAFWSQNAGAPRCSATPLRNRVIPGPLMEQYRFGDYDWESCQLACEEMPGCMGWDFGPMPLPEHVGYNCGLKREVTDYPQFQEDVVGGFSSRYRGRYRQ